MWKTFPFSQSHCDIHRLKSTATLSEILEALQNTVSGVGFLTHHPSLPSYTFVSADAVLWLIRHVEGVLHEEKAVEIMEVSVCPGYNFVKYQIKGCCPSHPLLLGIFFKQLAFYSQNENIIPKLTHSPE